MQPLAEQRLGEGRRVWTCRRRGAPGPIPERLLALLGRADPVEVAVETWQEQPPADPRRETGWRLEGRALALPDEAAADLPPVVALVAPEASTLAATIVASIDWLPQGERGSGRGRGSMASLVREGDPAVLRVGSWRQPVTLSAPDSTAPPASIRTLTMTCDPPAWLARGLVIHLERDGVIVASGVVTDLRP